MLQTVTIQNFKSLKDVTVNLQKVNLLIGPNNSGKSNFLKGLAFIKEHLNQRIQPAIIDFNRLYFNQMAASESEKRNPILFEFKWGNAPINNLIYHLEFLGYRHYNKLMYNELIGNSKVELPTGYKLSQIDKWINELPDFYALFNENESYASPAPKNSVIGEALKQKRFVNDCFFYCKDGGVILMDHNLPFTPGSFIKAVNMKFLDFPFVPSDFFSTIKIYKPDPSKIAKESLLLFDKHVNEDCSNLVAFLDNMRDEHPNIWKAIETDLRKCIPEFDGINFGKVSIANGSVVAGEQQNSIGKRFGLRDKFGKTYWAEELSEGTIYFLALLAIIHQPDPPKLLLLEEPEKGIHPRRISEVMNLIFRLAEEKDIQIILTTHSTQVVDEFQDIPESVFVFELQEGETKIKNLLTDIIEPDNKKAEVKGYPKLDFNKHSLGEHWAIGFLGGVPAK